MNRVKVKTREQVKSVKALDKAAIAGVRMKNAYIRTKEKAMTNREERQNSPTNFAGEQVQDATRMVARNAIHTAWLGSKIIRKGRAGFRRYKDKKGEAPPAGNEAAASKGSTYKRAASPADATKSPRLDPVMQKRQFRKYFSRFRKTPLQKVSEGPAPSPYLTTPDLVTERGREFAKKQAAKRRWVCGGSRQRRRSPLFSRRIRHLIFYRRLPMKCCQKLPCRIKRLLRLCHPENCWYRKRGQYR